MDEKLSIEDLRGQLGSRVDAAFYAGEVTVVTRGHKAEPRAVLVSYEWFREAESRREQMLKEKP